MRKPVGGLRKLLQPAGVVGSEEVPYDLLLFDRAIVLILEQRGVLPVDCVSRVLPPRRSTRQFPASPQATPPASQVRIDPDQGKEVYEEAKEQHS